MANYRELYYGSTGEDVRRLQEALNDAGYPLTIDGIYGAKTQNAVTGYQRKNGLLVDGIAGNQTQGHLYSVNEPPASVPGAGEEQKEPTPWEKWVGREAFSYDPQKDPAYNLYKEQYLEQGRLAMEDARGRAAALTGGYGNSYGETAGQQAFQSYVQKLAGVLPELYESAYDRYESEGEALYDEAVAYDKQRKEARAQLERLIKSGYYPTAEELEAVGMTRKQANALLW